MEEARIAFECHRAKGESFLAGVHRAILLLALPNDPCRQTRRETLQIPAASRPRWGLYPRLSSAGPPPEPPSRKVRNPHIEKGKGTSPWLQASSEARPYESRRSVFYVIVPFGALEFPSQTGAAHRRSAKNRRLAFWSRLLERSRGESDDFFADRTCLHVLRPPTSAGCLILFGFLLGSRVPQMALNRFRREGPETGHPLPNLRQTSCKRQV